MSYQVEFNPEAIANLAALSKKNRERIFRKINWLGSNFEQVAPLGLSANLSGYCKLRVGDYRVIYTITTEQELITIVEVGHRSEIYDV
jgi:mRNA interferase RelE/StbE